MTPQAKTFVALIALASVALPAAAPAATKKKKAETSNRPDVVSIRPKVANIGDTVLVVGNRFLKGTDRNLVFFKRGRQVVSAKGTGLDTHTITVALPSKMLQAMGTKGGKVLQSSFTVRVLAKHLGEAFTEKIKITIKPPPSDDCDRDGLQDSLERQVGSDICALDTDGDGLTDFFEYSSAKALNSGVYPFPGLFPRKKPIPNPIKADTDGDKLPDNKEDSDDDHLTAEREQEIATNVADMPACGQATDPLSGLANAFHNNLARPKPYFTDGAEDSDRDGVVDGGDLPTQINLPLATAAFGPYAGENIDCDGWVPRWEFVIPVKDKNAGTDLEETEDEPHFVTFADQSLCAPNAPRSKPYPDGNGTNRTYCTVDYSERAIACSAAAPSLNSLGNYVWLDNYAERGDSASFMQRYGDMYDADFDNDGVPDGCDDTDFDGYSNALEVHLARDQKWRSINTIDGDESTEEEGLWDPLDGCKPGPMMNPIKKARSGCNTDPKTEPNGPLGPGRPQEAEAGAGDPAGGGDPAAGGGTG